MKEIPGFINELVHALALCEDVDESTILYLSLKLLGSPMAAGMLTAFAEIAYSNTEMILSECDRLLILTGGRLSSLDRSSNSLGCMNSSQARCICVAKPSLPAIDAIRGRSRYMTY